MGKTFDPGGQKTIVIDWNGVLDTYQGWKGPDYTYPMRPGTPEFLRNLSSSGYKIVIMTAADPEAVKKWLSDNDIDWMVAKVTNEKVPAIVYLDDRAVCFNGNYDDALASILSFKPHWGGNT